jgi:hypothetical protein
MTSGWAIARYSTGKIVLEPIIAWQICRLSVSPITVGGRQQLDAYSLLKAPDGSYVKDNGWVHCADDESRWRNYAGSAVAFDCEPARACTIANFVLASECSRRVAPVQPLARLGERPEKRSSARRQRRQYQAPTAPGET